MDAIFDEHGLFQLAACYRLWVVVDVDELHRLVIDMNLSRRMTTAAPSLRPRRSATSGGAGMVATSMIS